MRKVLFLLLLLLFLAGCTAQLTEEDVDMDSFARRGEENARLLLTGNVATVYKEFSQELQDQLSLELLETQLTQLSALSSYKGAASSTVSIVDKYVVVDVLSELSSMNMNTRISYSTGGKIEGLFFSPAPLTPELLPGEREIHVGPHRLSGRLMLPEGSSSAPVAILIQGSGSHGMDEIIGTAGNAPLRDIAQGLRERGIASIRYDKRFYAHPQLAAQQMSIQAEVLDDVDWVLENIDTFEGIDPQRVYILGHSFGGMLAPDIAARHPKVSGILSLAGSPRSLEDIMMGQLEKQIEAAELTPEEKAQQRSEVYEQHRQIRENEPGAPFGAPQSYWQSLKGVYAPEVMDNVHQPIFILQGDKDAQIFVDTDYAAWQELLRGRKDVTFALYEGLNHLFMESQSDDPLEDYNRASKVDEQVIEDMAQWIHSH